MVPAKRRCRGGQYDTRSASKSVAVADKPKVIKDGHYLGPRRVAGDLLVTLA